VTRIAWLAMAHSPFIDIGPADRRRLLDIARESIAIGCHSGRPMRLSFDELVGVLGDQLASFVTLRQSTELRGCMGTLAAVRPLAEDVAETAFNAAFRDPRFVRVTPGELDRTMIEISVLTPMTRLEIQSERELFDLLTPLEDGLLIESAGHRATFLPKVWESLPDPADFLRALKQKAGLAPDHAVETLSLHRYTTVSFSEDTCATFPIA